MLMLGSAKTRVSQGFREQDLRDFVAPSRHLGSHGKRSACGSSARSRVKGVGWGGGLAGWLID